MQGILRAKEVFGWFLIHHHCCWRLTLEWFFIFFIVHWTYIYNFLVLRSIVISSWKAISPLEFTARPKWLSINWIWCAQVRELHLVSGFWMFESGMACSSSALRRLNEHLIFHPIICVCARWQQNRWDCSVFHSSLLWVVLLSWASIDTSMEGWTHIISVWGDCWGESHRAIISPSLVRTVSIVMFSFLVDLRCVIVAEIVHSCSSRVILTSSWLLSCSRCQKVSRTRYSKTWNVLIASHVSTAGRWSVSTPVLDAELALSRVLINQFLVYIHLFEWLLNERWNLLHRVVELRHLANFSCARHWIIALTLDALIVTKARELCSKCQISVIDSLCLFNLLILPGEFICSHLSLLCLEMLHDLILNQIAATVYTSSYGTKLVDWCERSWVHSLIKHTQRTVWAHLSGHWLAICVEEGTCSCLSHGCIWLLFNRLDLGWNLGWNGHFVNELI